jgi:hypothetical protein
MSMWFAVHLLFSMTSRHDLTLEQKMDLIRDRERGLTHRELKDKFEGSIGSVSNILKRKLEYTNDYEINIQNSIHLSRS